MSTGIAPVQERPLLDGVFKMACTSCARRGAVRCGRVARFVRPYTCVLGVNNGTLHMRSPSAF